jgi:hypothetical protein
LGDTVGGCDLGLGPAFQNDSSDDKTSF